MAIPLSNPRNESLYPFTLDPLAIMINLNSEKTTWQMQCPVSAYGEFGGL
jgi:hypothetical protein